MYDELIREIKGIDDDATRRKKIWELLDIHKADIFEWAIYAKELTRDECEFIYMQRPNLDWEDLIDLGDWFSEAVNFYINCKEYLDKHN